MDEKSSVLAQIDGNRSRVGTQQAPIVTADSKYKNTDLLKKLSVLTERRRIVETILEGNHLARDEKEHEMVCEEISRLEEKIQLNQNEINQTDCSENEGIPEGDYSDQDEKEAKNSLEIRVLRKKVVLNNLDRINILIGRNGSGKSLILQCIHRINKTNNLYIPPERGNWLHYSTDIELRSAYKDKISDFSPNQFMDFRGDCTNRFYRFMKDKFMVDKFSSNEGNQKKFTDLIQEFETSISKLTKNIIVKINYRAFEKLNAIENDEPIPGNNSDHTYAILNFRSKYNNRKIIPTHLSSGENELISMAMEIFLFFNRDVDSAANRFLLLDEPDAHLHPDAQHGLINFLCELIHKDKTNKTRIIVTTHSTAIIGALANLAYEESAKICFLGKSIFHEDAPERLDFNPIFDQYKSLIPIFGAHPLSQVFNECPILLIEGEDDQRIWQQAIRSSKGKIKIYPCVVGSKSEFENYEEKVNHLISSVYDEPKAYSLRDRDDTPEGSLSLPINGSVIRFRLHCRAAENLLLSDEVLGIFETDWESFKVVIDNWVEDEKKPKQKHPCFKGIKNFVESGYDRKLFDLKKIRNLLLVFFEKTAQKVINKPWEVIVGQVIGQLTTGEIRLAAGEHSMHSYLGKEVVSHLSLSSPIAAKNDLKEEKRDAGRGKTKNSDRVFRDEKTIIANLAKLTPEICKKGFKWKYENSTEMASIAVDKEFLPQIEIIKNHLETRAAAKTKNIKIKPKNKKMILKFKLLEDGIIEGIPIFTDQAGIANAPTLWRCPSRAAAIVMQEISVRFSSCQIC